MFRTVEIHSADIKYNACTCTVVRCRPGGGGWGGASLPFLGATAWGHWDHQQQEADDVTHLVILTLCALLSVVCCLQPRVGCCWQSWVCCLCKCYGGDKLCDFGTAWLHCQWVPFTTRFAWTILLMPFKGVLAIWPALWLVAWVQWVMICHMCLMRRPCWMLTVLWRL